MFLFPPCPEWRITPQWQLNRPTEAYILEEWRKRGQLHLRLLNKCITVWALCPGLSGSLAWNVPMRQSGAIGAWQLAAGRDNLLRDTEQRAAKDFVALVDTFSKTLRHANTVNKAFYCGVVSAIADTVSVQGVPVPGPNPQTNSKEGQGQPLPLLSLGIKAEELYFTLKLYYSRLHRSAEGKGNLIIKLSPVSLCNV
ncbi:hypothetical protein PAMP_004995 [Pampus punctatissimus]